MYISYLFLYEKGERGKARGERGEEEGRGEGEWGIGRYTFFIGTISGVENVLKLS